MRLTLDSIARNLDLIEVQDKIFFNLLLVDSDSNDSSKDLIKFYEKKYSKLMYINVPKRGVYFAQDQL